MRKSEIFEDFVKIAQEKGLLETDKTKTVLESNPRMDSLTKEDISKLYNLKIETPDELKYDKNIAEVAHKEPVVVSPSYDKLNGLVENINERNNILLNIVNKKPGGHLTNHKYAQNNLTMSLIRVANYLDNKDLDVLRKLADGCIEKLEKTTFKKEAALPLLLNPWVLGGIASLLGGVYTHQHINFEDKGYLHNFQTLLSELKDFQNENINFGVGYEYTDAFKRDIQRVIDAIIRFNEVYHSVKEVFDGLDSIKQYNDVLSKVDNKSVKNVQKAHSVLKQSASLMKNYLSQIKDKFDSPDYINRQIKERGTLTDIGEKSKLLGGSSLIASDFEDVLNAIPPYINSIDRLLKTLENAQSVENNVEQQLQDLQKQLDLSQKPAKPSQNFDDETDQLSKELEQFNYPNIM